MPILDDEAIDLGTMTLVQLAAGARKPFLKKLLAAAGNGLSMSELTLQDAEDLTYVVPKPLEDDARQAQGWATDQEWADALAVMGARNVNILSAEAVFRLLDMGRVKAAAAGVAVHRQTPLAPAPAVPMAAVDATLPANFRGPFDWHLARCKVPQAWAMFAASATHNVGLPWKDIRVGHIDTGYSEHRALGWSNGQSNTVFPADGHDFYLDAADPRDEFLQSGNPGHGTRIGATIAGYYPDAPVSPFYGVAPGAHLIPIRATDSVMIDHTKLNVVKAIRYAIAQKCDVITMCLGAIIRHRPLADALDEAYENGVIVVCAAGNQWKEVVYPGRYNRCVTMGAVDKDFKPWGGSARGQYVDLCAAGQHVRRVKPLLQAPGKTATDMEPDDGHGTSYATGMCSGAAALWLSWHGAAALRNAYAQPWMKVAAFKKLLRQTAQVPAGWDAANYGSGVIDVQALLAAPLPPAASLHKALPANGQFDPGD